MSLAMGEPHANTSPAIVASAVQSLHSGRTHYAPASGEPDLLSALAAHESLRNNRTISVSQIVLGHGATGILSALTLALVAPGDRVVIPEPTYSLYTDLLALVDAEVILVPNHDDGSLDLDRISRELQTASMLIVCNPCNPTGAVYTAEVMQRLAQILSANPQVLLVADEAYCDIVFDNSTFVSALSLDHETQLSNTESDVGPWLCERVIKVGTFSKTYAMTGWRLGYAVATPEVARRIDLIHRTLNGSITTFSQDAAMTALATDESELQAMRWAYQQRRDIVVEALSDIDRVEVHSPAGAFYALPRIVSSLTSAQLVDEFARGGVLVRAGSEYGPSGEGHVRLSFATDQETLCEGLRRFATVVARLPH